MVDDRRGDGRQQGHARETSEASAAADGLICLLASKRCRGGCPGFQCLEVRRGIARRYSTCVCREKPALTGLRWVAIPASEPVEAHLALRPVLQKPSSREAAGSLLSPDEAVRNRRPSCPASVRRPGLSHG